MVWDQEGVGLFGCDPSMGVRRPNYVVVVGDMGLRVEGALFIIGIKLDTNRYNV